MKQTTEALARTCLVLALAGTLVSLSISGCAPALEEQDSTMVERVTVVAAAQPTTPPVVPIATAAPLTVTPVAPIATAAPLTVTPAAPIAAAAPLIVTPAAPVATAAPLTNTPSPPVVAGVPPSSANPAAAVMPPDIPPATTPLPPTANPTATLPATVPAAPTATAASASLAQITVSYRLDPWLISGNYGGGFWASPPVLGPATQGGSAFAIATRAQVLTAQGQLLQTIPKWISSDPDMVTASPNQGSEVSITVKRAGQSSLQVTAQGVSKTLSIKAVYRGPALHVEIAQ